MKFLPFIILSLLKIYFSAVLAKIDQLPLPPRMQACFNSYSQRTSITETVGQSISSFCFDQYMWKAGREHGWKGFNLTGEAYAWANSLLSMPGINFRKKRQAMSLRVRKEYRHLSDEERSNFHRAIQLLKADTSIPPNRYDALSAIHQGLITTAAHGGPNFLGFHRVYLLMYENALREKVPSVTLPYWDSTLDETLNNPAQSIIFTETFLGDGNGLVTNGPFAHWSTMSGPLTRNIGHSGQLFRLEDMERVLSRSRLGEITEPNAPVNSSLEFHHNGIHMWIDGQMGSLSTAAHDPVFWMHHAYVDNIWERFRNNQRARGIDPTQDYPTRVDDAMHMPNVPLGLSDFRNIDSLSDMFTSMFYTYQPTAQCSSSVPNCGSPYLRCMNIRGRARCVSADRSMAITPSPLQQGSMEAQNNRILQTVQAQQRPNNGAQDGFRLNGQWNGQGQSQTEAQVQGMQQINGFGMQLDATMANQNRLLLDLQQQTMRDSIRPNQMSIVTGDAARGNPGTMEVNARRQQNTVFSQSGWTGTSLQGRHSQSVLPHMIQDSTMLQSQNFPNTNSNIRTGNISPAWFLAGSVRQNSANTQSLPITNFREQMRFQASVPHPSGRTRTLSEPQRSMKANQNGVGDVNARGLKTYGKKIAYDKNLAAPGRVKRRTLSSSANNINHQASKWKSFGTHQMQAAAWNSGILQNSSILQERDMCQRIRMSSGYQNTFNINGQSDIGHWVYMPVRIVYQRPPTYNTYRSFPIINGIPNHDNDIYAPSAYTMIRDFLLTGKPASYSKCGADQSSGAGKVYITSNGINYMGTYKEYSIVDHRLAISIATAYVAVKSPEFGASEVFLSAHDSCGRVCTPFCKTPGKAGFNRCSGAIRVTSAAPKVYGSSYGEAVKNLWEFSQGGGCPSMSEDGVQIQFHCNFQDTWPFGLTPHNSAIPSLMKTSQAGPAVKPIVNQGVAVKGQMCNLGNGCVLQVPCGSCTEGRLYACAGSCALHTSCTRGSHSLQRCPERSWFDQGEQRCVPGVCTDRSSSQWWYSQSSVNG